MSVLFHIMLWIATALTALFTVGCTGSETTRKLERAKNLMEEHPDSARMLLDGIDSLRLSRSQGALYAVLDAQSRHKLDMPVPSSDSLLNLAVERYTSRGPDSLLMKALFYRAHRSQQFDNIQSSIQDASYAWEVACKVNNPYWCAKIAEIIADVNYSATNMEEDIKWRKLAIENYKLAGKMDNSLFGTCDLILPLMNVGQVSSAVDLVDSLMPIAGKGADPSLKLYYYLQAVPLLSYFGEVNKAQDFFDSLRAQSSPLPIEYECYQAHLYMRQNNYKEAGKLLKILQASNLTSLDSLLVWQETAALYSQLTDFHNASIFADSLAKGQYKQFQKAMGKPVTQAQRDFYRYQYNSVRNRMQRQNSVTSVVWTSIVLLFIGAVVGFWLYRKRIIQNLTSQVREMEMLRNQMAHQEMERQELQEQLYFTQQLHTNDQSIIRTSADLVSDLKKQLALQLETQHILYRSKWETLNMLCTEFHESGKIIHVEKIKKYLESLRNDGYRQEVERVINTYMDGLILRMRQQCTFLSDEDIHFLTLVCAGWNAKTVAFFVGIKVKYFYNKKERLVNRIANSNAVDKEEIIRTICQR